MTLSATATVCLAIEVTCIFCGGHVPETRAPQLQVNSKIANELDNIKGSGDVRLCHIYWKIHGKTLDLPNFGLPRISLPKVVGSADVFLSSELIMDMFHANSLGELLYKLSVQPLINYYDVPRYTGIAVFEWRFVDVVGHLTVPCISTLSISTKH